MEKDERARSHGARQGL
jgi:hypothetical protein